MMPRRLRRHLLTKRAPSLLQMGQQADRFGSCQYATETGGLWFASLIALRRIEGRAPALVAVRRQDARDKRTEGLFVFGMRFDEGIEKELIAPLGVGLIFAVPVAVSPRHRQDELLSHAEDLEVFDA